MLKGIPEIVDPELLYVLASLGHGDELAIVDRNYPAESTGQRIVYLRGVGVVEAAEAIFHLLPIDTFVERPIVRMEVVGRPDDVPEVQQAFFEAANDAERRTVGVGSLPRFEFYDRVRSAFAVVATSESRPYGCFLVTTGVL